MENPELARAQQIIAHTDCSLFLTGRAGTGKTTFLRRLRERSPKRMVVLAPTGIAAINAGGTTIHSFLQLPFAPYIPGATYSREQFRLTRNKLKLIRSLDLLVIDEVSMVRADLLDAIDDALRRYRDYTRPFGGVQLLLIGDLRQLAPVVKDSEWELLRKHYASPFFFCSKALQQTQYVTIELQHIYRQSDPRFIALLNKVRDGAANAATLAALNQRYRPTLTREETQGAIRLVTHNHIANSINERELAELPAKEYTYRAEVKGNFPEASFPTDARLRLKKGAQIMFVKNDPDKRYFNGMLGHVVEIDAEGFSVQPDEQPEVTIAVTPAEWSNARYQLNEKTKEIEEKVDGTFTQYPVRTAWAITIHKSQGLTFERAIIDAAAAFAHGQTYVALSRLKSLEGLTLSSPIPPHAIINDASVQQFSDYAASHTPTAADLQRLERDFFCRTALDLFTFSRLRQSLEGLLRIYEEHFFRTFPKATDALRSVHATFLQQTDTVSQRFIKQIERLVSECPDYASNETIAERLEKGARYFGEQIATLRNALGALNEESDNKVVAKRLDTTRGELAGELYQKDRLLDYVERKGFDLTVYQQFRSKLLAGDLPKDSGKKATGEENSKANKAEALTTGSDILRPILYTRLVAWRRREMAERNVPAYVVASTAALIGIANHLPLDLKTLQRIKGIGKRTVELYGAALIEITQAYQQEGHDELKS